MLLTLLKILFVTVCLLIIVLILLQKGRGGGLSGAFGGGGGHSAFGAKTGDVLTWATVVMVSIFLLLAVGLNLLHRPSNVSTLGAPALTPPPAATASPSPPTAAPQPAEGSDDS
jgi:preprotein translocase subunit SecG